MNFLVLKCFQCATFQVHQSKKTRKWICKLCGVNQSMIKGTSRDCQKIVQESNLKKKNDEIFCDVTNKDCEDYNDGSEDVQLAQSSDFVVTKSKWLSFKPSTIDQVSDDEEPSLLHDPSLYHLSKQNSDSTKAISSFNSRKSKLHEVEHSLAKRAKVSKSSSNSTHLSHKQPTACESSKWNKFRSNNFS